MRDEDYVEAIKDGEIVKVSESVAREEDLFILRKLVKSERIGFEENKQVKVSKEIVKSYSRLEEWKSARGNLKRNNVINDLVDNFQWEISRMRRKKGLSRRQLADKIGALEEDVKMIEMGDLPRDDFVLINKIEGALSLSLRKVKDSVGGVTLSRLQKMNEDRVKEEIDRAHGKVISGSDVEILGID